MTKLVENAGLQGKIVCDSAGTGGYHVGEAADLRMRTVGARRGFDLTSISRKIEASDLEEFQYIITMDSQNFADVEKLAIRYGFRDVSLYPMCHFCKVAKATDVPDPYYGGPAGFEHVFELLEDACAGLLEFIRREHGI